MAILCGLDHSREIATHFAQERLFVSLLELAVKLQLPVLIMQVSANEYAYYVYVYMISIYRLQEYACI